MPSVILQSALQAELAISQVPLTNNYHATPPPANIHHTCIHNFLYTFQVDYQVSMESMTGSLVAMVAQTRVYTTPEMNKHTPMSSPSKATTVQ